MMMRMSPKYLVSNPQKFILPNADLTLYSQFFSAEESVFLFEKLLKEVQWEQGQIKLFGKTVNEPRKSVFYGDDGIKYTYSGKKQQAKIWTENLFKIKEDIETVFGLDFNCVLANLYQDGQDSMGWHSDNEKELGQTPSIISISFGATRVFQIKSIKPPSIFQNIKLTSGSLFLMQGTTQHYYKHQIAKTKKCLNPRINLTFRKIFI